MQRVKPSPWPPWILWPSLSYLFSLPVTLLPPQWAACQLMLADQKKTQPITLLFPQMNGTPRTTIAVNKYTATFSQPRVRACQASLLSQQSLGWYLSKTCILLHPAVLGLASSQRTGLARISLFPLTHSLQLWWIKALFSYRRVPHSPVMWLYIHLPCHVTLQDLSLQQPKYTSSLL